MMKQCNRCGRVKDISGYYKNKASKDGYSNVCIECTSALAKQKRAAKKAYLNALSADARKDANLRRHYGITLAAYENMLAAQGDKCAICGRSPDEFKRAFAVDHDHKTGIVRGILCPDCNRGLGGFHDNPELLRRAADFLEKIKPT